jgi:glycosyltransferase involved in cell wall biosynthesis
MNKEELYIITNESFNSENDFFFCDNIDLKSIPEELNKYCKVNIIGRKSKIKKSKIVKASTINIFGNIFSFLICVLNSVAKKKVNYLIISISPYTFFASIILKILSQKHFIYLRSDGYEEYKSILGFFGPFIYHIMFTIACYRSDLISCRKHILKNKKGKIVHPSQLNDKWLNLKNQLKHKKMNLLYVGRLRVEKGIFSLLKMLENTNLELTIITSEKKFSLDNKNKNVSIVSFQNYNDTIIKFYDEHSIFILPSYTEAHPQVLDEALARRRPVIIFKEISHVVRDREGIFISERNINSLSKTIDHIANNYDKITNVIQKNTLPTKANFINELKNIILRN